MTPTSPNPDAEADMGKEATGAKDGPSHTPGPWTRDTDAKCPNQCIRGADGTHVVCFGHDYDDYGGIMARWPGDPKKSPTKDEEAVRDAEIEANARLIAAAPALLAACRLQFAFIKYRQNRNMDEAIQGLRELVAIASPLGYDPNQMAIEEFVGTTSAAALKLAERSGQ